MLNLRSYLEDVHAGTVELGREEIIRAAMVFACLIAALIAFAWWVVSMLLG